MPSIRMKNSNLYLKKRYYADGQFQLVFEEIGPNETPYVFTQQEIQAIQMAPMKYQDIEIVWKPKNPYETICFQNL